MSAKDAGQKLREAREARGQTLVDASEATHIRSHYLKALEEGEFGLLPSPTQVRGFLRTYAEYLDLDANALFDMLKPKAEAVEPVAAALSAATVAAPAADAIAQNDAQSEFSAIGAELRKQRESLQLTPAEVELSIHIPEHYVARLENGRFDEFPSPTQARGMLSNYADFLGLEGELLLARYAEALQQRFAARQAAKPVRQKRVRPSLAPLKFRLPDWLQPLLSRDIIFGTLAGIGLLIFVIFSIARIATTSAGQEPEPTAPPLIGLLLPTDALITGTPTNPAGAINLLGAETPTPGFVGEATIQVAVGNAVGLRILATQRTWMRVTVDGQVQFEGRTVPGQNYTFTASNQILLLTGNAAGLRIFFNEQDLGILGIFGEVIQVIFNAEGAATPTVSPTPTIDPAILTATSDAALTPSATPSATTTPTPEPTATVSP
jgi:cytoskeleton protein RodZ